MVVAASNSENGLPIWQTNLGVPVTMISNPQSGQYEAVNSSAMYFRLDPQVPLRDGPDNNAGQNKSQLDLAPAVQVANGMRVMLNQSRPNQLAVLSTNGKLQLLTAAIGTAVPTCPLIAVENNIALALDNGQLVLLDPSNGSVVGSPFQPTLAPGTTIKWNEPVYVASSKTLYATNDQLQLVRIGVNNSLRKLSEIALELPLDGPLAFGESNLLAVETSTAGDMAVALDATNLKRLGSTQLGGQRIAGPFTAVGGVLIQTSRTLELISNDCKTVWSQPFVHAPLVSAPVAIDQDELLLATTAGVVIKIRSASGEIVAQASADQPFCSTPLVLPTGLLVGSDEGCVIAMPMPTSK